MREAASQINFIINAANQQILGLTVKYFRTYAKVVIVNFIDMFVHFMVLSKQ